MMSGANLHHHMKAIQSGNLTGMQLETPLAEKMSALPMETELAMRLGRL